MALVKKFPDFIPRQLSPSERLMLTRVADEAALTDIVDDLDTTQTIAILSVALYMLSMSIFPLWWYVSCGL